MNPIEFIELYLNASEEVKILVEDALEECQQQS